MAKQMQTTATQLPAEIANEVFNSGHVDDLLEGLSGGFGVVSFRGGKWRIKHGGEEILITNADDEPVASIPVVLVKASPQISKIYYEKNYEEGDDAAPDCWSVNGVHPDTTAPKKQAAECASCPMNQWGSRVTDAGKKAKKCSDNRRIAVVPAARKSADADASVLENEVYGGPMLMRIPPASLSDMAAFARDLKKRYPAENYNSIVTLIGFDPDTSYPKLTFKALRRLSDDEKELVIQFWTDGSADNVLATSTEATEPRAAKPKPKTVDTEFEEDEEEETVPVQKAAAQEELDLGDEDEDEEEMAPPPKQTRAKSTSQAARKGNGKAASARAAKATKTAPAASSGSQELDDALDDIANELDELGG